MPDFFDDDDDNFDPEDFDFDPNDLPDDDEKDNYRELPVFKKAESIRELTRAIVDTFDKDKDKLMMRELMMENAYIIGAKIAGASAGGFYSLRMEKAMLIKIHARELQAQTSLCKAEKLCNQEYIQLLRKEIEDFRILFIEWVRGFDKTDDLPDEWDILNL